MRNNKKNRLLAGLILYSFIALGAFSCATTKGFTSPQAYVSEGLKYYNDGDHKKAAKYFEKAIKLQPTYQPAHSWLGATYAYLGRKDEALREFERVVKIDPDTKDGHSALKWIESLREPICVFMVELEDSTNSRRLRKYNLGRMATESLARNLRKTGRYEVNICQPQKMVGYFPKELQDIKKLCSYIKEHEGQVLIIGSLTKVETHRLSGKDWYAYTEALVHLYSARTGRLIKSINGSINDWPVRLTVRLLHRGKSEGEGIEKSLDCYFETLVKEIKKSLP